jgi:hypothetical protein
VEKLTIAAAAIAFGAMLVRAYQAIRRRSDPQAHNPPIGGLAGTSIEPTSTSVPTDNGEAILHGTSSSGHQTRLISLHLGPYPDPSLTISLRPLTESCGLRSADIERPED